MMNRLLLFPLTMLALYLSSCSSHSSNESTLQLSKAEKAARDNPSEVADLLKSVNPDELDKDDYHTYMLLQARQLRWDGIDVSFMEQTVHGAIDHFTRQMDVQKVSISYYAMAKVYESKDEPAKAVHYYLSADEWAAKSNYTIASFTYPDIPYSIAYHYKQSELYQQSIGYLHKALQHVDRYNDYEIKLYTLELLGNNYNCLNNPDSAFFYYDKARSIAVRHNDLQGQSRIICNSIVMLLEQKSYDFAEAECNKLLTEHTLKSYSNVVCLANVALSKIYYNTNRIDRAAEAIDKAKELLGGVDSNIELELLEQLSLVEKEKGNLTLSNRYLEQYDVMKAKQELEKQKMLAEVQANLKKREQEFLAANIQLVESGYFRLQKEQRLRYIILAAGILTLAAAAYVYISDRERRRVGTRRAIAQHISVKYSKAKNDEHIIAFINKMTKDEEEREILLDNLYGSNVLATDTNLLEPFKRKLFGASHDPCDPILTDMEVELCYLINTQMYSPIQIANMLGIDMVRFVEVREALEHKILKGDYRLPHGYRMMQAKAGLGTMAQQK